MLRCTDSAGQSIIGSARLGISSLSHELEQRDAFIERIAAATVDSLTRQRGFIVGIHHAVNAAKEIVMACDTDQRVDKDGTLVPLFEVGEGIFRDSVARMEAKRKNAFDDMRLKGDHSKRVIEAYSHMINALKLLHDATSDLRWAILDHDSELDPIDDRTFSSADDLMNAALGGRK